MYFCYLITLQLQTKIENSYALYFILLIPS